MRSRLLGIATGLAAFLSLGRPVSADTILDRAAPEARKRFDETSAAYKGLANYADSGRFVRTTTIATKTATEEVPLAFRFGKPNRFALDAGEVRVNGDGKILSTVLAPTRRYLSAPSPAKLSPTEIADGPAGAILFGGPGGQPAQLVLKLVLGAEGAAALPDRATGIETEEDRAWEGKTYPILKIAQGDEPALRVYLDPETKLIRRVESIIDSAKLADRIPGGAGPSAMTLDWYSGAIETGEPRPEVFSSKPPEGYAAILAAEAKPAAVEAKNEMIGKPSPDFTLTLLDGSGKTKKVTKADLAGKVVLLDFWATWCPPCLAELPEIQKLAEEYAREKKTEVVIVAVSQDRAPEDGSEVRKLVEGLLTTKKLDLASGPIARVALDPEQIVGDGFKVQALPTVVILDGKGVVQSVHVGFDEDVRETLAKEIDALLEGKTLVPKEKADPKAAQ